MAERVAFDVAPRNVRWQPLEVLYTQSTFDSLTLSAKIDIAYPGYELKAGGYHGNIAELYSGSSCRPAADTCGENLLMFYDSDIVKTCKEMHYIEQSCL